MRISSDRALFDYHYLFNSPRSFSYFTLEKILWFRGALDVRIIYRKTSSVSVLPTYFATVIMNITL